MAKKQLAAGTIVGAVAVTALGATTGYRILDSDNYAPVLSVRPVTETVFVSQEECRAQLASVQNTTVDPNQLAGTVVGVVIGGLAGSQIGDGDGSKVATVSGAVAGGYAGKKIQEGMQERNVEEITERECEASPTRNETNVGYDVTYLLDGQERTVRMSDDPGWRIPVEDGHAVIE